MSEESKVEIAKKLHNKNYYLGSDNKLLFRSGTDVVDLVLASMTG